MPLEEMPAPWSAEGNRPTRPKSRAAVWASLVGAATGVPLVLASLAAVPDAQIIYLLFFRLPQLALPIIFVWSLFVVAKRDSFTSRSRKDRQELGVRYLAAMLTVLALAVLGPRVFGEGQESSSRYAITLGLTALSVQAWVPVTTAQAAYRPHSKRGY